MADALLMSIKDLPGESQLTGFEGQIELLSFSHGVAMQVANNVSNTKRTTGKPMVQEFTVTKVMDASTPMMNQKCVSGENVGEVVITIGRNDAGKILPLMIYTLGDTYFSSISVGGGGGGEAVETVTLNFSHIKWDYQVQNEEGGAAGVKPAVWDLAQNVAS